MKYSLALLALAAVIEASPFPQGVTAKISPSGKAPPGCKPTYTLGTFGVAVMNISTAVKSKRQVSTISDGQPQAPTASPISTISDHQPQAPTGTAVPISTISDHQPQAPTSTAVPISTISDHQPQAPTGTVVPVSTISDHQPQAPMSMHTMAKVSQIIDGQVQGGMHTVTMMPVSQISDGQIQGTMTYMAVSTIVDGQPQAPTLPKTTKTAVSTISDHQPQAPTGTPVSTISDNQPQAPTSTKPAVSTISDLQPQGSISEAPPPSSTSQAAVMVACKSNSSLEITLSGGVMHDAAGRTGYIAANFQFQFDKPPQHGALFTAGWSVCANGSLALGGSNVFWQCLSGDFYNIYNEDWAPQCSPVTVDALQLVNCS